MAKQPLKESETVELKKSLAELKQGLVSMTAILNKHQAGILWFGVRNNGAIAGIDANEKTLRDLSQSIAAHIEPKSFHGFQKLPLMANNASKLSSPVMRRLISHMAGPLCGWPMKTVS